jgi:hypothetical protein
MRNTKSILTILVVMAVGGLLTEAKDTADAKPVNTFENLKKS